MPTPQEKLLFIREKLGSTQDPEVLRKLEFIESKISTGEDSGMLERAGETVLSGLVAAGEFVDKYTGAPTRAAIEAGMEGESPLEAFGEQFGEDPGMAPTGKQIAQKLGVTEKNLSDLAPGLFTEDPEMAKEWLKFKKGGAADISGTGAAGLVIDILADPTNIIPGKVLTAPAKGGLRLGKKVATKTIDGVEHLYTGGKILSKNAAAKVGGTITGLSPKSIETYIDKYADVKKLIREHGGDTFVPTNEVRKKFKKGIDDTIKAKRLQIKEVVKNAPNRHTIDVKDALESMEEIKGGIVPELYADDIAEIQEEIIDKINSLAVDGQLKPKNVNDLKDYFQNMAKGSYQRRGQMFTTGSQTQKAAKDAARMMRELERKAMPATGKLNDELVAFHNMDDAINKNLIKEGAPEAALMAAGRGENMRSITQLKELEKMTDQNILKDLEKIAAASEFADARLIPKGTTGLTATRAGTGASVGLMIGSMVGSPAVGAAMGVIFSSPATLKTAIKTGRISDKVVKTLGGGARLMNDKVLQKAIDAAGTPEGALVLRSALKSGQILSIQKNSKKRNMGKMPSNPNGGLYRVVGRQGMVSE